MIGRSILQSALALVALAAGPLRAFDTVIIDAGHGGSDRGGIPRQRIPEDEWTLKTALRLSAEIKQRGFTVVMTRTSDEDVSLAQRCRIANSRRDAIFVSVHYDAYRREAADGITAYYASSRSEKLARSINSRMVSALRPSTNRGAKRARFYVIRNTLCPAVLVECGFLTNKAESKRIQTSEYQDSLAKAIADGVTDYRKYRTGR
ncbi:MAG TPA: N-acetylmuramoyl-L-alanine amidase [Verrucomicrobiae bacterium]|nr:N-acetylmuramoyl-L-alanine amidase [Verrucomicrobiae bacterium]